MGNSAKKLNVLVVGLDGAGKTTMLYHMRLKEVREFKPTNGAARRRRGSPSAAVG